MIAETIKFCWTKLWQEISSQDYDGFIRVRDQEFVISWIPTSDVNRQLNFSHGSYLRVSPTMIAT